MNWMTSSMHFSRVMFGSWMSVPDVGGLAGCVECGKRPAASTDSCGGLSITPRTSRGPFPVVRANVGGSGGSSSREWTASAMQSWPGW